MYRTQEFKNFTIIATGPATGLPVPLPSGQVEEFPASGSFSEPHRRTVSYAYLQDEWSVAKDWTLTAGLRHDRYSDVGSTTNPRVALVWDSSLDLTTKLLYGRAFRAPSFTEQYSINNPVVRGNPLLKPEKIETLEAAVAWQARADVQLNLSLYRYNMRDGIRNTQAADGSSQFNNVGRQHGHGLELEARWQASRHLRLSGYYAWQQSIDEASGQDAGYAPRRHLWLRADGQLGAGWQAGAQLNHVADRHRAAGDARPPMADYSTLDLNLRSTSLYPNWEFALAVRNLFNADVREPSLAPGQSLPNDLPLPRRNLWLQAVYRL
jgi:iron complex outermembrane receptor protein